MSQAFTQILETLQRYYDGLYYCDPSRLETAFHPGAHYHTASSGAHLHYDMSAYMEAIKTRRPPAESGDAYGYEIESIRFAGDDTAFAVLTCAMMGKRFTDFLSLIRIDESWRIVAKVFHFDPVE